MADAFLNQTALAGGFGGASSYESSYSSSSGNYGGSGFVGDAGYEASSFGAGFGAAGLGGSSSYEASSFGAGAGYGAAGFGGSSSSSYEASSFGAGAGYGAAGLGGSSSYEASSFGAGAGAGFGAAGLGGSASYEASSFGGGAGYDASSSSYSSSTAVQKYATDAQGLFQDSNPQIIRRPAPGGNVTYTQNIRVRFLQPPPVPPPGPLIIKEVRPPQPPPPPPLRIRQQAPPRPQPPPLILRERPPRPPASVASQTVIRRLAALPVPPRSTIIERIPAAPPRPRDIIIERWVPYGAAAKRRTVVQRAAAAKQYAAPRNTIIQYEPVQVRVVRQFQKLGVTSTNPQAYVQQYGASLLDSVTLVHQARAAGVTEDLSPPVYPGSFAATEGQFSATGGAEGAGGLTGQGAGGIVGELNYEATAGGVGSRFNTGATAYEQHGGGVVALESPAAASAHVGSAGEGATGYGAAVTYSAGAAVGEEVNTYGAGATSGPGSAFASTSIFNALDANHDGVLSAKEFSAAGY